jgi:dienelactone hydrolase
VVIVDDGIATGATARAACQVARAEGAARVVLAVPVAPPDWVERLGDVADELVAVDTPPLFQAVGQFYRDFSPTTDGEVVTVLQRHAGHEPAHRAIDDEVVIPVDGIGLDGSLAVPADARGVVVFAHGSGSSRHSPRNRAVAAVLQRAGLGTLLFDLLTDAEARDRSTVFDIELLATRLGAALDWLADRPATAELPIGLFGASTGAAAALWAAAEPRSRVAAVVSRGGRPDLAAPRLADVRAPTRLIVGGRDDVVLALNRDAASQLRCEHDVVVVPGATHLFEEPGTLDVAATSACEWFVDHLARVRDH